MKLLFFIPHLGGGGAEMNTVRIANALIGRGIDVHIATSRPGGGYRSLLSPDVIVHELTNGRMKSSLMQLIFSAIPLIWVVWKIRPKIVCPVMISSGYVVSFSSLFFPRMTKKFLSVQNTLRIPARSRGMMLVISLLNAFMLRGYDRYIALSQGVAADLADLLPISRSKISVINNCGFDERIVTAPQLDQQGPRKDAMIFIACGRLSKQKGYPYLLDAFSLVKGEIPAKLRILGDGPDFNSLYAYAQSLGVIDDVEFLGFVENPTIWFQQADVFVLSSLWEGFANVIVEAMSIGLPVIATDCPHGPSEIITDGHNGLLVRPKDTDQLAEAMMLLASNAALRARLGQNGLHRANDFVPHKIADQWLNLFEE